MKTPFLMTAGPTRVRENVRLARAKECSNPDLDLNFYDFYRNLCIKIGKIIETKQDVRILSGEGILGLEAACASFTEQGDRVLVVDNGIFGEGFGDFVKMYGGKPVYFKGDREHGINISDLENFLIKDNEFKYATIVHCDTPSGVLNPLREICKILKKYGIATVVDAVSSIGGEEVKVDEWEIDVCLGASQKVLSAPPGLTFLSISDTAWKIMENRESPIAGFYCNLLIWKDYYEKKWFPYTMPISDIEGLNTAVDNYFSENTIKRHQIIASSFRKSIVEAGLELYTKDSYSNTVSVIKIPDGIDEKKLRKNLLEKHNLMISGAFGYLEGKVIRIGHMGEGAREYSGFYVLKSLEKELMDQGFKPKKSLTENFINILK
ncbi:pyridoxal-phosphate-dependent aminotransferase family protein [Ilyobacter polytropus]|uniref:Aminotransferase class V n=1 Tax=Ilyobacter polytropus (strain ATCC 51220 / DSM 2926 / LMG 16218 / CuHBu1) TaxID=572544 RepID=E3H8M3_ILYPC|nr:alanine--glyoxylate aminotransferase family protein [Ilyobacter polytropus]ADO83005.1 aminotransferase class V [Ilyobacter polytropus DSM 2926]